MRALMLVAAAATIAGCSRPAPPSGSGVADALAGRVAGPTQACVTTNSAENLHVLDAQTVAYGYGRTIYINRLGARCPALDPSNMTIVEAASGGQYCRGDKVRGNEPGSIIPGPACILRDWVPYRRP